MKICENGICRDMTPEEIEVANRDSQRYEAQEAHRPLDQSEVLAILAPQIVNTLDIPDETSLRMKDYYPEFGRELYGKKVKKGFKFTNGVKLYKVAAPELIFEAHFPPGPGTESLYTEIPDRHLGNQFDPIPYGGNMALEEGKYYSQDGVLYLCTRGTGNAVHQPLKEMVEIFVKVVDWPSFF